MTANGVVQIGFYFAVLLALVKPLGFYMARVYEGRAPVFGKVLRPVENLFYRLCGIDEKAEMNWRNYATALLLFNVAGMAVLYVLLRVQSWLPLNPAGMGNMAPYTAFNIAASFASNTNWQNYGGETTLSFLSQMVGLTTQNFVSAATGMAVLAALIRGFQRREAHTIGNFWVDLTRTVLYILLPLSLALAAVLMSQGVAQTLTPYQEATTLESGERQTIAVGPAASQIAIKQLGTNGGGFYNVNSAHPLENPTPLSNFIEMLAILLIPAALCFTFGQLVNDRRQGWAILSAMTIVLVLALGVAVWAEQQGTPQLAALGVDQAAAGSDESEPLAAHSGGNMEGKEVRFGIANSVLWATATTAASNGSVNSMHDSFTPLGGLMPMWLMQLGEVIFGGVGSGLYGMLLFAIVAVFVAGLMVGRTPEYIGKKIGPFEMKMASLGILVPPLLVLIGTALAVMSENALAGRNNSGPHGLSEILYAFSSMANNNGSAFAGLGADRPLYNLLGGLAMLGARFWVAIPALAIAGSLAAKKQIPASEGTLPTHGPLFVLLLIAVVLVVGALTFLPVLALGPIVEHLMMIQAG